MKKSLLALAALSAFATAAQAQSSVTVYGILDVGMTDRKTDTTASNGTTLTSVKQKSTGNTSAYTTSRLGFRGVEDLGGGLKAGFNYELGIGQNDATQTMSTNNTARTDVDSNFGNGMNTFVLRQANVNLSGGFGTVTLGRQTTAVEAAWGAGDVGGSNNFVGRAYTFAPAMNDDSTVTTYSAAKQNNDRSDRLVTFQSPTMNGFAIALQYGEGKNDAASFVNDTQKETGIALSYNAGKLQAVLGYQKEKATNNGANVANGQPTQMVIGANYDLGAAKAFITYADSDNKAADGSKINERTLQELGVSVPMGKLTFNASILDGEYKPLPTATKGDISGYQLAALYAFSKRTTGYAVIGEDKIKGLATSAVADQVKRSNAGFGIRHAF
jgi:predicted porin